MVIQNVYVCHSVYSVLEIVFVRIKVDIHKIKE